MSDKDQHLCVLCDAEFKSKDVLQEHFRKHGKELDLRGKPLVGNDKKCISQCDLCQISFLTTSAAIRHRFNVHPNLSMKFYCHYCGKQFPLKIHRDHHQLSHNEIESERKEKHRKCEECNVLFYNEEALKYHYRCNHQTMKYLLQSTATPSSFKVKVNSKNNMKSVYYCHSCDIEYSERFYLRQHLKKVHMQDEKMIPSVNVIKCTVCSAIFRSKVAYNAHKKYHKPINISSEQQRHNVTKADPDFDIRVKTAANKDVLRSNVSKKQIGRELNKKQRVETKKIEQEIELEIKEEIKQEIKEEYINISSSDDDTVYTNDSSV